MYILYDLQKVIILGGFDKTNHLTIYKLTSYIQHKTRKIGHKVYSTLYYPILLIQCIKPLNTLLTSLILLSGRDVNRVYFISL